jgi:hypothetical protein
MADRAQAKKRRYASTFDDLDLGRAGAGKGIIPIGNSSALARER